MFSRLLVSVTIIFHKCWCRFFFGGGLPFSTHLCTILLPTNEPICRIPKPSSATVYYEPAEKQFKKTTIPQEQFRNTTTLLYSIRNRWNTKIVIEAPPASKERVTYTIHYVPSDLESSYTSKQRLSPGAASGRRILVLFDILLSSIKTKIMYVHKKCFHLLPFGISLEEGPKWFTVGPRLPA